MVATWEVSWVGSNMVRKCPECFGVFVGCPQGESMIVTRENAKDDEAEAPQCGGICQRLISILET